MKVYLDTEFLEAGATEPIHCLSIGLVREDAAQYYAVNVECPVERANPWVREHVVPHLFVGVRPDDVYRPVSGIAADVRAFAGERPEIWGWYADYDWVVLCGCFGTMVDLPPGWPKYCRDLKQEADRLGVRFPAELRHGLLQHHALDDARWIRRAHGYLLALDDGLTEVDAIDRVSGRRGAAQSAGAVVRD